MALFVPCTKVNYMYVFCIKAAAAANNVITTIPKAERGLVYLVICMVSTTLNNSNLYCYLMLRSCLFIYSLFTLFVYRLSCRSCPLRRYGRRGFCLRAQDFTLAVGLPGRN